MNIKINKSSLSGTITIPPSKSAAHRALICAALSFGDCKISNIDMSDDITATVDALKKLGCIVDFSDNTLEINATYMLSSRNVTIDCNESGSTLRFLLPVAAIHGGVTFTGKGRLPDRPIDIYYELFKAHNSGLSAKKLPVTVDGFLSAGKYELPGDVSSQFITGLLFALPLLPGDSEIVLSSPLQSTGYVDLTLEVLEDFSVVIDKTKTGYYIKKNQHYTPRNYTVEGDWSSATFWLLANYMGQNFTPSYTPVKIERLKCNSKQGDRLCEEIFKNLNKYTEIDASNIPDAVPAIIAAMTVHGGRITNAARLRLKESDRIKTTAEGLIAMGIKAEETDDGLIIHAGKPKAGIINSHNDHRIAMAFSILAAFTDGESEIINAECVRKSYPDFYKDLEKIGGLITYA